MNTETPAPPDLTIPDAAVATLHVCDADSHLHDRAETCVRAIAAPVVAAELRRIAVEVARPAGLISVATETGQVARNVYLANAAALRARADVLDPPATEESP